MKKLLRAVMVLLLAVFVFVAVVVTVALVDAFGGESPADVANVTISANGDDVPAYVAAPRNAVGPSVPAVILLHEWWGLNHEITEIADELAAEGYLVIAPDAYGGRTATTVPGALWLRLTVDKANARSRLEVALDYLRDPDGASAEAGLVAPVDPLRVGALGFCFGGDLTLWLAQTRAEDLSAMVVYYGGQTADEDELSPIASAAPVLGIFGDEDAQIPVEEVEAYEAALNSLGIQNDVVIYEGVGHAFLNAENLDGRGAAGQAWQRTLSFLAMHVAAE